jgi:hypothetical protein
MWGRLSSLPVRRTFQSGLGRLESRPNWQTNVCPTPAVLRYRWPTSEFRVIIQHRCAGKIANFDPNHETEARQAAIPVKRSTDIVPPRGVLHVRQGGQSKGIDLSVKIDSPALIQSARKSSCATQTSS